MPQKIKTVKSFSQLNKINKRELYEKFDGDLRLKPLDRKFAVSMARQLASGFDNVDLRSNPSNSQYRRARKVIDDFYNAIQGPVKIIRPAKRNRKKYAEHADISANFKIYPVPISNEDNIVRIKRGKIRESGNNLAYRRYYFNPRRLVENPTKEAYRIWDKANIKKNEVVQIIVGRYTTNYTISDKETLAMELERYAGSYSNFKQFTRGIQVVTFLNQKIDIRKLEKIKKRKKRKISKRERITGRK